MALQSLNTILNWPGVCGRFAGAPTVGNVGSGAVDAAGEYIALVFAARQAMTISHVGFMTGTVAGAATADVRIETVGATGLPSGSLWAANTNIVTGALTTNTWTLVALTAAASIAAGDVVAVKIARDTGTSFVTRAVNNWNPMGQGLPYLAINQSGSAAKGAFAGGGTTSIVVGSGATSFYSINNAIPFASVANNAFNNTNGARRGIRFQVPFICRAVGIRNYDNANAGDRNVAIFDDAGSELNSSSKAYDGDHAAIANTSVQDYMFDNPVTLSPGTWYRAVIEPSSATNCNISTITLPSADYRSATPGGVNQHYTTFASAAWSDTATDTIALMDILIDQLDDGLSGTSRSFVIGG